MLEIICLNFPYGTAKLLSPCPPTPAFIIHLVRHDRLQYWLISSISHYMSIIGVVRGGGRSDHVLVETPIQYTFSLQT